MTSANEVFSQAPKAIVHLRAQLQRKRLGLVFGAGISRDLKFPTWEELVDRLKEHAEVDAVDIVDRCKEQSADTAPLNRSLSTVTQMFYSRYRDRKIVEKKFSTPLSFVEEQEIRSDWIRLIHTELYKDRSRDERLVLINNHPYLKRLNSIIKRSRLTVTYNFDDSIERMLYDSREDDERNTTRGYEVIDRPNAQFQRDTSVVYHPNGYLPSTFEDGASAHLVFADDSFQDQLLSAANGKYLNLSNHLFANTCLLVGLSLNDATLQSLLRQNAVNNPGNIHYAVHYVPGSKPLDEDIRKLIFNANFESYSVYTLFLDEAGIASLANLISMNKSSFKIATKNDDKKFVYYVIGSVGAGKSTAASNFRNLITYEEWIDARKPELAVPESQLTPAQRIELNEWVAGQFMKKNLALSECEEGIHLIDRCPLDPLTFGDPGERPAKAQRLIECITEPTDRVHAGHIIYLQCVTEDVQVRSSFKHKYWSKAKYKELIDRIGTIYDPIAEKTSISTQGRSAEAVAKEIARVIFLGDYTPVDVGEKLLEHASSSSGVSA